VPPLDLDDDFVRVVAFDVLEGDTRPALLERYEPEERTPVAHEDRARPDGPLVLVRLLSPDTARSVQDIPAPRKPPGNTRSRGRHAPR
jgi:hypothetical protein